MGEGGKKRSICPESLIPGGKKIFHHSFFFLTRSLISDIKKFKIWHLLKINCQEVTMMTNQPPVPKFRVLPFYGTQNPCSTGVKISRQPGFSQNKTYHLIRTLFRCALHQKKTETTSVFSPKNQDSDTKRKLEPINFESIYRIEERFGRRAKSMDMNTAR
jgi:hypothetical protein